MTAVLTERGSLVGNEASQPVRRSEPLLVSEETVLSRRELGRRVPGLLAQLRTAVTARPEFQTPIGAQTLQRRLITPRMSTITYPPNISFQIGADRYTVHYRSEAYFEDNPKRSPEGEHLTVTRRAGDGQKVAEVTLAYDHILDSDLNGGTIRVWEKGKRTLNNSEEAFDRVPILFSDLLSSE